MSLTEGLLIVIVLILTVIVLSGRLNPKADSTKTKTWDCVNRDTGDVTSVKMAYAGKGVGAAQSPESASLSEQAEHFEGCRNSVEDTARALDCMCDGDSKFEYAVNEFGAPGMEFKDWVASQSIDPTVIKNHAEFVKDREKLRGDNVTGRTTSYDSHDSYDPQPWLGIRGRPQAVAVCNPTQVTQMDVNLFSAKPKLTWSSSEVQ